MSALCFLGIRDVAEKKNHRVDRFAEEFSNRKQKREWKALRQNRKKVIVKAQDFLNLDTMNANFMKYSVEEGLHVDIST